MYDFDPKKDYYKILWVAEDASKDEIKKAFKKLAIKYHPDKAGGDKEKFQAVNEAHGILTDDKKKQQYDMIRKWWIGGMWGMWWGGFDFSGFQWGGAGGFDFGGVDLWDIVGNMFWWGFGWRSRGKRPTRWADIKHRINISFEESFLWVEKKIAYTRMQIVKWAKAETCSACHGKWATVQQVQTPFGTMQTQNTCPACEWSGKIYKKNGKTLWNGWLEQHKETLTVKIPAGIKDGVYIKYEGQWHAGIGGTPAWDLYIQIGITTSKIYQRKWNDLYVKSNITLFDLVLGGTTEVPHPEWKLKIKIPKGTQIGDLIKISGKWFGEWWIFSSKGNLYIDPVIHIPKRLSKEQEKLWKKLQKMK